MFLEDGKQQQQNPAKYIRLMDASGSTVLDSVSTDYEDSFCLESFGDLIKAAEEAEPAGTAIKIRI
jgi:anti-anti-sigma regulatory factor